MEVSDASEVPSEEALLSFEQTISEVVIANGGLMNPIEIKVEVIEACNSDSEARQPSVTRLSPMETDFIKTETLKTSPTQIHPTKGQQNSFEMSAAHQEHQSPLSGENMLSSVLETSQDETDDVIMIIQQPPKVDLTGYSDAIEPNFKTQPPPLAYLSNTHDIPKTTFQVVLPTFSADLFKNVPASSIGSVPPPTQQFSPGTSKSCRPEILGNVQVIPPTSSKAEILMIKVIPSLSSITLEGTRLLSAPSLNPQSTLVSKSISKPKIQIKEEIIIPAPKFKKTSTTRTKDKDKDKDEEQKEKVKPTIISIVKKAYTSNIKVESGFLDIEDELDASFVKVPEGIFKKRIEDEKLRQEQEAKKEEERKIQLEILRVEQKKIDEEKLRKTLELKEKRLKQEEQKKREAEELLKKSFELKEEERLKERLKNDEAKKRAAELVESKIKKVDNEVILLSDSDESSNARAFVHPKKRMLSRAKQSIPKVEVKIDPIESVPELQFRTAKCNVKMEDLFSNEVKEKLKPFTILEKVPGFVAHQIKIQVSF